jgi:hypothetical protein
MDKETRITDSRTGGQKGSKLSQIGWAPPEALIELGKVYGYGATKYSPTNYRRGYLWSLSVNAMMRHIHLWLGGESYDSESKCHHLIHAAWHCFCLFMFERRKAGKDDIRWEVIPDGARWVRVEKVSNR